MKDKLVVYRVISKLSANHPFVLSTVVQDGALQTCSKIVDAARGASATDLYKIATAVVGVGGNVLTGSVEAGSVNKTDSNSTDEVSEILHILKLTIIHQARD